MIDFKLFLNEEVQVGQAIDAHEPTERSSSSVDNSVIVAKVNQNLSAELSDNFLSPEAGFQKIRKVLHTFGMDMPAMYDLDQEGDELVLDVAQFGESELGSGLLYVLYYLSEGGYYEFYSELTDEDGIEELLASGLEDEDTEE